jgi:hypothetical protein
MLMAGAILSACGTDKPTRTTPISLKILDKQIPELLQGASEIAVESRLGKPDSRVAAGSETVLTYGPWRLVVENGGVARRIRARLAGQGEEPSNLKGKALDQKILAIKPGVSIADVRRTLGAPEGDEEVFEGARRPDVVLTYGAWVLSFRNGELRKRTKF